MWHPLTDYFKHKRCIDGRMGVCRLCRVAKAKARRHALKSDPVLYAQAKEYQTAQTRKWREQHPGYFAPIHKAWREGAGVQWKHKWRHNHKDEVNANNRAKYEINPARFRQYRVKRRALRAGSQIFHSWQEWEQLKAKFGHRCLCCSSPGPLTRDHIVPLSHGGSDDITNIAPLCQSCNSRKGTKHINYRWDRLLPPP